MLATRVGRRRARCNIRRCGQREISLLIEMEHRNVLKVFEYIVDADPEHVYIITE